MEMKPSRARLLQRLRVVFGERADEVRALLDETSWAGHACDPDEVRLAVVERCEGSFENLQRWLIVARDDYRDVLGAMSAEDVRKFNEATLDDPETSFDDV